MNDTWSISKRHVRWLMVGTLLVTLGCATISDPLFWSGLRSISRPFARVDLSPDRFCVGETLTASWFGGPQIRNCDLASPDIQSCKRHYLSIYPYSEGFSVSEAYPNIFLGSASGTADFATDYTATYKVEWDGWSNYRAYRQAATDGRTWTGIAQGQDTSSLMADTEYEVRHTYTLSCDEATDTWQLMRGGQNWQDEGPAGFPTGPTMVGYVSACSGITEICVAESDGRVRVSAAGGPTVTLGGTNPLCTMAFMGYQPEDITIALLDYALPQAVGSPCNGSFINYPIYIRPTFDVAASNMCGQRFVGDSYVPAEFAGADSFEYGSIPLVGAAVDRCRAALDPEFLASYDLIYGLIPPGGGGGSPGEPAFTPTPSGSPDQPTPTATTGPVVECGPGWLPASGCSCCGTTLTCADGTIAEFNPTCMGGGQPDVCGDGVCSPAEGAVCGTCSADCGPC